MYMYIHVYIYIYSTVPPHSAPKIDTHDQLGSKSPARQDRSRDAVRVALAWQGWSNLLQGQGENMPLMSTKMVNLTETDGGFAFKKGEHLRSKKMRSVRHVGILHGA